MRFHKKEGKGIGFGELIPILYPDQQITIDTFKKLNKEFREGKKRRLTEEEKLNIYKLDERQRFKFEKRKAKNMFHIGMVLAFIVLFITLIPVYIYIPNYSFFIINCLFLIDILFTICLYCKQYNVNDKLRERDMYLNILDIKKNISDLANLIENINKKDKI